MNLNIEIAKEAEPILMSRAAAAGKTPAAFAADVVTEQLVQAEATVRPSGPVPRTDFAARLRAIVARHDVRCGTFDDSRESIYAGRGE